MENVVFVTTMWDIIKPDVGAKREEGLFQDTIFGDAVKHGARMCRHYNTLDSAQRILLEVLHKGPADTSNS